MEKIIVTEKMHPEKEWFEEAEQQTLETLPEFIQHVMNDYYHDYGTVVHAISACAIAAAWAANGSDGARGGITGFQAGFVMWDFIKQWRYHNNKTELRIIDFDYMLYPQYESRFEKKIGKDAFESLQKEAAKKLEENQDANPGVIEHWKSIVDGNVPFGYSIKEE